MGSFFLICHPPLEAIIEIKLGVPDENRRRKTLQKEREECQLSKLTSVKMIVAPQRNRTSVVFCGSECFSKHFVNPLTFFTRDWPGLGDCLKEKNVMEVMLGDF